MWGSRCSDGRSQGAGGPPEERPLPSQGWERRAAQAVFLEEVMTELSPEGDDWHEWGG